MQIWPHLRKSRRTEIVEGFRLVYNHGSGGRAGQEGEERTGQRKAGVVLEKDGSGVGGGLLHRAVGALQLVTRGQLTQGISATKSKR